MGCICSKGISADENVSKQPCSISGQELVGARQTKCMITSNKLHKVYNEQPLISYGPESVEIVFLRALGVAEKQIPIRFEEKTKSEQEGILMYLYMNWNHLQQDSSVIKALKETRFVTSAADKRSRDLYKPKDLFDPGDPLLASVFSGEVHKFPGKRFTSDGRWLNILRKTGLQNTDVADTMLECAQRVEFLGAKSMKHNKNDLFKTTNGVSLKIWSLAETLVEAIFEKKSLLYDQKFCNIFGKIVCIPAERGNPFESGKEGVKRVLCSYSEAILLKDRPLAWSTAPVVTRESLVPPDYSWEALQLRSPPPFPLVLNHLQTKLHTESSLLNIEDAVFEVLQYLDRIWGTLSSADISKLKKIAFMPLANTEYMGSPSFVFSRPTIDLSPIAFGLPSRYLPFLKILKELGLQETLSISSALFYLKSLKKDCGYQRINPNELRAVMKILHFLFNEIIEQQKSDRSEWESLLVVPDDSCRLVHPSSCVYVDPYGSRYMNYISSSKLRFAHHDIPERLCLAVGIRKLSDVVVEELDCVEQLQTLEEIGSVSLAAIRQKLLSLPLQVAISGVLHAVLGTSENPIFQTLKKSLESISQRLQFVRFISTRFRLLPQSLDITNVSMIPVWKSGSANHQILYYIDPSKTCMLIAEPPSNVSVLDLVALVVSHVLGSPVPLSIGSLFLDDSETDLADILKLSSGKRVMDYNIGILGREVAPEDAKKAYLNHTKPFYKGQIVAWRREFGYKLKYGRITEDITIRQPIGKSNYEIKLETSPGKTEAILLSFVYSFKVIPCRKKNATHVAPKDGDNEVKCVHVEQPDPSGSVKLRNQVHSGLSSRSVEC